MINRAIEINIVGEQFRRNYLIYCIIIISEAGKFLYIGQTGNNNYKTARPAFRRLAGHFNDSGGATDNQIYRYIAFRILNHPLPQKKYEKFSNTIKTEVEKFLIDSTIKMKAYPVYDFDSITESQHDGFNKRIKKIEKAMIYDLQNQQVALNLKMINNEIKALKQKLDSEQSEIRKKLFDDIIITINATQQSV